MYEKMHSPLTWSLMKWIDVDDDGSVTNHTVAKHPAAVPLCWAGGPG